MYNLMQDFIQNFNLDILYQTYTQMINKYSDQFGFNITTCTKPSYTPLLKHINPYYTKKEIIYIALNTNLIKIDDISEKLKAPEGYINKSL